MAIEFNPAISSYNYRPQHVNFSANNIANTTVPQEKPENNKSGFKEDLSTQEDYKLDFTKVKLADDEYIIETMFDFGKVETGFRESTSPTMECMSLDTLKDNDTFTNHTKTVGVYHGVTAEANSDWTTVVHIPEKPTCPTLPRNYRL